MEHFDVALFDVDKGLQTRLGYSRIYTIGKDIALSASPSSSGAPMIVRSKDQNSLSRALKDPGVVAIIFEDSVLNKKFIEKAAESRKPILIPVSAMLHMDPRDRQSELSRLRKILESAHSLGARCVLVTLAERAEYLVSTGQMAEVSHMLMDTGNSKFVIFGGDIL